jgi:hypothetical protein
MSVRPTQRQTADHEAAAFHVWFRCAKAHFPERSAAGTDLLCALLIDEFLSLAYGEPHEVLARVIQEGDICSLAFCCHIQARGVPTATNARESGYFQTAFEPV